MADEDEVVDAGEEGGEEVDAEEGEGGDEAEEAEEAGSRASSRRSTPKPPSLIFDCGMRMELVLNRLRALHMDHLTRTAYDAWQRAEEATAETMAAREAPVRPRAPEKPTLRSSSSASLRPKSVARAEATEEASGGEEEEEEESGGRRETRTRTSARKTADARKGKRTPAGTRTKAKAAPRHEGRLSPRTREAIVSEAIARLLDEGDR